MRFLDYTRSAELHMSVARVVLSRIRRGGEDRLWTYNDFADLPSFAVAAALSRLTKKRRIRRVQKGVYYVPRVTRFGTTNPDPPSVVAAVLTRRGIAWSPTGHAAYNRMGLTTQVSPTTTFAVSRKVRLASAGPNTKLSVRPAAAVRSASADERAVLDALRDLRWIPDTTPENVIARVSDLFRSNRISFERVARFARWEPPRVRAVLGAIGSSIVADPDILEELKASLNPMTHFSLGLSNKLATARKWNIR
jgi:hypothetical protein